MNRMPVSAWRCVIGLRPGERNRRFFGGGRMGSITFQSSSVRISSAMCASSRERLHMVHRQKLADSRGHFETRS